MFTTKLARLAIVALLIAAFSGLSQTQAQTKNTKVKADLADKLGGVDLNKASVKVDITEVTNVSNVGGGGENRDFRIKWKASTGLVQAKINSFRVVLTVQYAQGEPFTKAVVVSASDREATIRVPELGGPFVITSFTARVEMRFTSLGNNRVTVATKSGKA